MQGVEIVPSVGPFYGFSLSGGFTVLDETHSSQFGHTPLRVPKRSAYGIAQYNHSALLLPRDKIALTLAYTFVGDREDITLPAAPRITTPIIASMRPRPTTRGCCGDSSPTRKYSRRVSNVFDRNYSVNFGFPAPPVNFVAGIKLEFE